MKNTQIKSSLKLYDKIYFIAHRENSYNTVILDENFNEKSEFENYYIRNVKVINGEIIGVGFRFTPDTFLRRGVVVKIENFKITNEILYLNTFSDFFDIEDDILIGNSYKLEENSMNGDIFRIVDKNLLPLDLPTMIEKEWEVRNICKLGDKYYISGIDKDNFRGIIFKIHRYRVDLLDIDLHNDLWEIVKIVQYRNKIFGIGNMWNKIGMKGFIIEIYENTNQFNYNCIDVPILSEWFELTNLVVDEKETLIISGIDYENNKGFIAKYDNNTFSVDQTYKTRFFISENVICIDEEKFYCKKIN